MNLPVIRTSQKGWLQELAKAYKDLTPVQLLDDAEVGIDPSVQSILQMGNKAALGYNDWIAVIVSVGVSDVGAGMVALAFLDPEPTTKLSLLVGGGVLCVLTGGFSAIRILTSFKPPSIKFDSRIGGFEIRFD